MGSGRLSVCSGRLYRLVVDRYVGQVGGYSPPGPDGYPRVLDYSIFKSLLVPYSKNFTTRSSSRVVTISYFLSNHSNIQKMEM